MLVQREVANNARTYPTDKYKLNTQGVYTKSLIDLDLSNIYLTMSTKANSADVYYLPDGGIPDTDMSAPVLTSLEKANTARLDDNLFVGIYGTTTATEILDAVTAGKGVIINYNNSEYIYSYNDTNYIYFTSAATNAIKYIRVAKSDSGYLSGTAIYMESANSKKSTITGNESSNTYYPTTKAVADYVNGIVGDIGDILDEINGEVI